MPLRMSQSGLILPMTMLKLWEMVDVLVMSMVKAASGKTGENIVVKRFVRFEMGEA